jgi:hypothetical protein
MADVTWPETVQAILDYFGESNSDLAKRLGDCTGGAVNGWRKGKWMPRGHNATRLQGLAKIAGCPCPAIEPDVLRASPAKAPGTTAVTVRAPSAAVPRAKAPAKTPARLPAERAAARTAPPPPEAGDVAGLVAEIVSAVREATLRDVLAAVRASVGV